MYAPTGNVHSLQPVLMRFLVRSWEYRHPHTWSVFRFAAGVWNLILGVVLLCYGYWHPTGIGAAAGLGAGLLDRLPPTARQRPAGA
jgi:hypothetical protein